MENLYETVDLQESAYFYVRGLDYVGITPSKEKPWLKAIQWPKEEALRLLEEFNNGGLVKARSLFNAYHKLRLLVMPPKNQRGVS